MAVMEAPSKAETDFGVVAILDDDVTQAKTVFFQLEELGLESLIVDLDSVPTLADAVEVVRRHAGSLITDVQLNNLHGGIEFDGAELVAALVSGYRMPCVLTTGFAPDVWAFVRPHRRDIPVMLARDDTEEPERLLEGLQRCAEEIQSGRDATRRTYRVPLFIERVATTESAIDVRVGGWKHKASMRFPATMLHPAHSGDEDLRDLQGKVFFAKVNIGADTESELFFEDPEAELFTPDASSLHFG
jgi:FixJ family two-component response regulator